MKKYQTEVLGVGLSLLLASLLGGLSIYLMGDYGWTVFLSIPFFLGFVPGIIVGYKKSINHRAYYSLALISVGASYMILLVTALEGLICLAMALPLVLPLAALGARIAYQIQKGGVWKAKHNLLLITGLAFVSMGFDMTRTVDGSIKVQTEVIIDADIELVWDKVIAFSPIEEPEEWYFKAGLAYPMNATIEGEGVGAIRYCNFSTGPFVEPITKWDEPHLLQFEVTESPAPMTELNPFGHSHPPHLDDYFRSERGQFELEEQEDGTVLLRGTSWYQMEIYPLFYWEIWASEIIHSIHERVLEHIKKEAEADSSLVN